MHHSLKTPTQSHWHRTLEQGKKRGTFSTQPTIIIIVILLLLLLLLISSFAYTSEDKVKTKAVSAGRDRFDFCFFFILLLLWFIYFVRSLFHRIFHLVKIFLLLHRSRYTFCLYAHSFFSAMFIFPLLFLCCVRVEPSQLHRTIFHKNWVFTVSSSHSVYGRVRSMTHNCYLLFASSKLSFSKWKVACFSTVFKLGTHIHTQWRTYFYIQLTLKTSWTQRHSHSMFVNLHFSMHAYTLNYGFYRINTYKCLAFRIRLCILLCKCT